MFNTRVQKEGERIDTYVTDLKQRAASCEFENLQDSLIRDRVVCGIKSDSVKKRLLREENLTLQRAIDICRANEASESQIKNIADEKAINHVGAQGAHGGFRRGRGNSRHNNNKLTRDRDKSKPRQGKCKRCGTSHARGNCPAYGEECRKCGKMNHFEKKMCKSWGDRVHMLQHESDSDADRDSLSGDEFLAYGIETTNKDREQDWMVRMKINDISVDFKIDTGAQSCLDLKLVQRVNLVDENQSTASTDSVIKEYQHLFSGIGCLPGEYDIKVNPNVTPKVHPPRRTAQALTPKVKEELDRMVSEKVITKVEKPTTWVNPIVIVEKPNEKVKNLFGPKGLESRNSTGTYPLKTVEEVPVAATLKDAKVFSTLDAASGFCQIKLSERSTWVTTFNTPYGRYKFERLPFGISSAPEIFQRSISQIFSDIDGCSTIADDILIYGRNQEHDQRLSAVLTRAQEVNLRFNRQKCKLSQKSNS
ncbi:uncharacterized protein LOC133180347 [Saccostrea echinata]|uniref:uncharacterized protein LOC133180347 n=1 Tax=Saccostrea echinata TaxID=191078 RepID=UPI002A7FC8AB|nr:uncharacterized protein LOC133180347 [Saccostrea echinata]